MAASFLAIIIIVSLAHFCDHVRANDIVHNNTLWNNVIQRHLTIDTVLDGITLNAWNYSGVYDDPQFHEYVNALADANTTALTEDEFYGFFANVYNALAVNLVLENSCAKDIFGKCGPIKSIREIGNFPFSEVWNKNAGVVGGKQYSLQQIEDMMRDPKSSGYTFGEDPRLHACIVCASISCPNIASYAYDASPARNAQYTVSFNNFLSNTKKGMLVDKSNKKVTLSKIFDWYAGDFQAASPDGTVVGFIVKYLDPQNADYQWLNTTSPKQIQLSYFGYNWDLNMISGSKLPCTSGSRPCYTLLWFLVTLAILALALVILAGGCWLRRRCRRKMPAYEELKY